MAAAALRAVPSRSVSRTPEREALAAAIAERDEARRTYNAALKADQPAYEAIVDARGAVDAAAEHVAAAGGVAADQMIERALGNTTDAPLTIVEARRAHDTAKSVHEAARAAHTALRARIEELEGQLPKLEARVEQAAKAVMAAESADHARATLAQVERLHNELTARSVELEWHIRSGALPRAAAGQTFFTSIETMAVVDASVRHEYRHWGQPSAAWPRLREQVRAGNWTPWEAALAALKADAGAALPTGA